MSVDSLGVKSRVRLMLAEEELCIACLNRFLSKKKQKLVPAGGYEDKVKKTDAFLVEIGNETDVTKRCAIKVRTTTGKKKNELYDDILVAVRDPFYGLDHEKTKVGRDVTLDYHWYIVRDKEKTTLRVADGKEVHRIIDDMWEEWCDPKFLGNVLSSKKHPGCQMRKHYDAHDGHPKILGFIPPTYLKKDVFFVPYKEDE